MCAADSGKRLYSEAVHSRGSGATVPNDLEEPGQDSFFGEIRLQNFGAVVPRLTGIRRHKKLWSGGSGVAEIRRHGSFGAAVLKLRKTLSLDRGREEENSEKISEHYCTIRKKSIWRTSRYRVGD